MPKTAERAQERAIGCLLAAMSIGLIILGGSLYLAAHLILGAR